MDFLDPEKQRAHSLRLIVGYVLIGLGVLVTTIILIYQAYGFGLGKNGEVIQRGLVFLSSQPSGAQIYLNDKLYKSATNSKLQLDEGTYKIAIQRDGYRSWNRSVTVEGGSVARYDYPLLIANNLTPVPVKNYATTPGLITQSPDRKWMLIEQIGSVLGFDLFNISDPKQVGARATTFSLPAALVTANTTGTHSWKLIEWSTDNRRVILEHDFSGGSEYILLDHEEPDKSINLTKTLNLAVGQQLTLRDKKYDKYYIFDPAAKTLSTATLSDITPIPVLTSVLAFKSYSNDIILYATDTGATPGKVMTVLKDGDVSYQIREIGAGGPYLTDLARYDGDWFVTVGASSDNKVYVFKNPQTVRKTGKVKNLVPIQILRVTAPNYLSYSTNTRFIMIENATNFAIYDAETDKGYTYATSAPMDAPQAHATWMDGHRITFVSGGKIVMFDYDNLNTQTLVPSVSSFLPIYDPNYKYLYAITPPAAATGQTILTATSLLTDKDR